MPHIGWPFVIMCVDIGILQTRAVIDMRICAEFFAIPSIRVECEKSKKKNRVRTRNCNKIMLECSVFTLKRQLLKPIIATLYKLYIFIYLLYGMGSDTDCHCNVQCEWCIQQ